MIQSFRGSKRRIFSGGYCMLVSGSVVFVRPFFCCSIFSTFFTLKAKTPPTLPTSPGIKKIAAGFLRISGWAEFASARCTCWISPTSSSKVQSFLFLSRLPVLGIFTGRVGKFCSLPSGEDEEKRVEMKSDEIHHWNLTWKLKRSPWRRRFLLETIIFRFHVKFRGSTWNTLKYCKWWKIPESSKKVWTLNPLNPLKNRPSRGAEIWHPWSVYQKMVGKVGGS